MMTTSEKYNEDPREQEHRKQEDRRIKNRAAAQESRTRKKKEEMGLRKTIEYLTERNTFLESENARLKERLSTYEVRANIQRMMQLTQNTMLSHSINEPSKNKKRKILAVGTTLCAILMLIAMPLTPNRYVE